MTTTEKNRVIAEWMGEEIQGDMIVKVTSAFGMGTKTLQPMEYDLEWSELIPVWKKIRETLQLFRKVEDVQTAIIAVRELKQGLLQADIQATFNAVFEFITWDNNQKNK